MNISLDQVEDIVVGGINGKDHPDHVDAYIAQAIWKESGIELSDEELINLQVSNPEYASATAAFDYTISLTES